MNFAYSAVSSTLLFLSAPVSAATAEGHLRSGNALYTQEKYEPALKEYAQANKKNPTDPRPVFNAADAMYRLEAYDQATETFKTLTAPEAPPDVRSDAYYNLGNVNYRRGEYKEAVENYRQALALRPKDGDFRHNLALALRHLKNPPPKKQNKDSPENKKQPEQKKDQPKPQDQSQGGGENKPPEPAPRPQDQISREDAERIMRAVAEKEKSQQRQVQKRPTKNEPPEVEQDW